MLVMNPGCQLQLHRGKHSIGSARRIETPRHNKLDDAHWAAVLNSGSTQRKRDDPYGNLG
jgi:hypothetical protein